MAYIPPQTTSVNFELVPYTSPALTAINFEVIRFADIRQAIIDGLTSAQSEDHGWNVEVKAKIPVTAVVRTSNTIVTITLPAEAAYDITSPETITVTVPASALSGAAQLVATPNIIISANITSNWAHTINGISLPSTVNQISTAIILLVNGI